MDRMEAALRFPAVVWRPDEDKAEGFLRVNDEDYYLACAKTAESASWGLLEASDRLCLEAKVEKGGRLMELLTAVRTHLEQKCLLSMRHVEVLAAELNHFDDVKVSDNWRNMEVSIADTAGRLFTASVTVDGGRRDVPTRFAVSLSDCPTCFAPSSRATGSLSGVLQEARTFLHRLAPFFSLMEHIDATFQVIEPKRPQRHHAFRRVKLQEGQSVRVTINPGDPLARPQFKWLGKPALLREVGQMEVRVAAQWPLKHAEAFSAAFAAILPVDVQFVPKATDGKKEEEDEPCGVCYNLFLDEEAPSVTCPKEQCQKVFHRNCISEWFDSVAPTGMDDAQGECPYCRTHFKLVS